MVNGITTHRCNSQRVDRNLHSNIHEQRHSNFVCIDKKTWIRRGRDKQSAFLKMVKILLVVAFSVLQIVRSNVAIADGVHVKEKASLLISSNTGRTRTKRWVMCRLSGLKCQNCQQSFFFLFLCCCCCLWFFCFVSFFFFFLFFSFSPLFFND